MKRIAKTAAFPVFALLCFGAGAMAEAHVHDSRGHGLVAWTKARLGLPSGSLVLDISGAHYDEAAQIRANEARLDDMAGLL